MLRIERTDPRAARRGVPAGATAQGSFGLTVRGVRLGAIRLGSELSKGANARAPSPSVPQCATVRSH
jgi:hypothetical protein